MTVSIRYAATLYDGHSDHSAIVAPPAYFTPLEVEQPETMPAGADPVQWISQRLSAALNGVTFHGLPDGVATSVFPIHDPSTGATCDLTAIITAPAPVLAAVREHMETAMRAERAPPP